ncbi:putative aflatoxin biosynthesis ketoreductase nor-1 [Rhexocercosporidium sp. MPI-PUGE-AT-0058]|nr:putative aflatoxin biosynthesis ketoreductase nor-1 [Rhexocercosporidium sp. MPI-PUGE-AT-0058]
MKDNTYLITGANRGIGLALTTLLLLRPNTTVIATIRTPSTSTSSLTSLPTSATSKLIVLPLDFSTPSLHPEIFTAFSDKLVHTHGIKHINTIIANAGTGTSFHACTSTPLSSLTENFETNTFGPILLYQTLYPLLTANDSPASENDGEDEAGERKFILISSSLGSIAAMEGSVPSLAYGISKAAANYFVRKVHFEEQGVVAIAVHPGIGVGEPPMSVEESASGVLEQIDGATKATTSGSFLSYDGTVIPW